MTLGFLKSKFLYLVLAIGPVTAFVQPGHCDYYYHPYYHSQATPIISLTLDPQESLNCDLRMAAREGNVDRALRLIDLGAKVNGASDEGKTALMYAAETCNLQVGKALLAKGAKLSLQDRYGRNALMFAAMGSCAPMISVITVFPGSFIHAIDKSGRTALDYANESASLYEEGAPVESVRLIKEALMRSSVKMKRVLSSRPPRLVNHSRS
jgi:ankyrin repeat protein